MMVMRWRETWRGSMASAVAAGLAWVLAQHLFGHSKPLFAAISAIICLSPGLPSHAGQALGLLVGVAIGSGVGELSLFLPEGWPLLRLGVAAFVAILAAATLGLPPVVPIQSGVSAILALAFGPETAGSGRVLDVAGGAAIGLWFSQVLSGTRDRSCRTALRLQCDATVRLCSAPRSGGSQRSARGRCVQPQRSA
jgi:uncharacterized membrane protein YgaE (UPF0421/DUF939 family)